MVGEHDSGLSHQQHADHERRRQARQPADAVGPPEQAGGSQHVEHEQDREHVPPVLPPPQRHLHEVEKPKPAQEQDGEPFLPLSLPYRNQAQQGEGERQEGGAEEQDIQVKTRSRVLHGQSTPIKKRLVTRVTGVAEHPLLDHQVEAGGRLHPQRGPEGEADHGGDEEPEECRTQDAGCRTQDA